MRTPPLLVFLLSLALPFATAAVTVSPTRCVWLGRSSTFLSSTSSTFAVSTNSTSSTFAVSTNSTSSFYASTSNTALTLHSSLWPNTVTGAGAPDDVTISQLTFPTHPTTSPCLSILPTPTSTPYSASPAWGHSVDVQGDLVVIGNPNQLTYADTPQGNVSFIDVVTASISLSGGWNYSAEAIWDFTTPYLGTLLSLAPSQHSLASLYTLDSIVIYTPVIGRASQTLTDGDSVLSMPLTFFVDSLVLMDSALYVTGLTVETQQKATLMVWVEQGGVWTMTQPTALNRIQSAASALNILRASVLGSRVLPSTRCPCQ